MDNLTSGRETETNITFLGNNPKVCRVWTNSRSVVTRMSKAGFEPDESDEWGVSYIDIPTSRIFRPSKKRKPLTDAQRASLASHSFAKSTV